MTSWTKRKQKEENENIRTKVNKTESKYIRESARPKFVYLKTKKN